ncbi:hypothetical protein PLUTE_a1187 [Pseudoalteromonas luteoviolacea DSM 6061]|nr:hypothetical protein [Pseudoalteromonas luteoviolacea DSM 6061]
MYGFSGLISSLQSASYNSLAFLCGFVQHNTLLFRVKPKMKVHSI